MSALEQVAWRTLERALLGGIHWPGLSVLIFHQVLDRPDPLRPNEPDIEVFETLVRFLSRNFPVRRLSEAVPEIVDGQGKGHAVAITFDDGYANNFHNALPVLKRYGAPATFFVTTEPLDSGIMWNDRLLHALRETPEGILDLERIGLGQFPTSSMEQKLTAFKALVPKLKYLKLGVRGELVSHIEVAAGVPEPPRLMMTREQVKEIGKEPLADVGGHTVSHPILARLPEQEAKREICAGKEALEGILGRKISCFAYPNGIPDSDYGASHVRMVREAGFELAVSTSVGGFASGGDVFQIPRVKPWDKRRLRFGMKMLAASRRNGRLAVGGD